MNYDIIFECDIEKILKKIPKKEAKAILEKIESLAENPRPRWVEKMKSRPGYRVAQGNYRIIYTVDDSKITIYVVDVDNRKDIYKK
jgi:mRNA interferase RelE/StbE